MDEVKNEKREENYGYNSGFSLYYLNYFDICICHEIFRINNFIHYYSIRNHIKI